MTNISHFRAIIPPKLEQLSYIFKLVEYEFDPDKRASSSKHFVSLKVLGYEKHCLCFIFWIFFNVQSRGGKYSL